jgi:hypothetical protein
MSYDGGTFSCSVNFRDNNGYWRSNSWEIPIQPWLTIEYANPSWQRTLATAS